MQGDSELDKIIKSWATAYNEEVLQYSQPAAVDDSEVIFLLSILIKLLFKYIPSVGNTDTNGTSLQASQLEQGGAWRH